MQKNFSYRDEKGDDCIKCTNMKGSSEEQNKHPEIGSSLNETSENSKIEFEIMNLRNLRGI